MGIDMLQSWSLGVRPHLCGHDREHSLQVSYRHLGECNFDESKKRYCTPNAGLSQKMTQKKHEFAQIDLITSS